MNFHRRSLNSVQSKIENLNCVCKVNCAQLYLIEDNLYISSKRSGPNIDIIKNRFSNKIKVVSIDGAYPLFFPLGIITKYKQDLSFLGNKHKGSVNIFFLSNNVLVLTVRIRRKYGHYVKFCINKTKSKYIVTKLYMFKLFKDIKSYADQFKLRYITKDDENMNMIC